MMEEDYGERYAYETFEVYEKYMGITIDPAFRMVWDMARLKNKHLGIYVPDGSEDTNG